MEAYREEGEEMMYQPVIIFASKDRARRPIDVLCVKHYEATFPLYYKTEKGATNFAERTIEQEDGVWQLPGAKKKK